MSMLAVPIESANEGIGSITPSISSISLNTGKEIKKPQGNRKTKIVATIGPKTQTVEALSNLIKAGMNVARMNFSHGDHSFHETTVRNVREASRVTGKVCAILLDNKGPEIRTGKMKDNGDKGPVWLLKQGQPLEIHCTLDPDFRGDDTKIAMDYVNMPKVVKIGAVIKIGDGLLQCVVQRVQDQVVHTIVANTCEISNHKGVNLPGARVDLPALTPRDELDLQFAVKHQVDFFAASFVRKASDVTTIRGLMAEEGKDIKIIAKIESQEGLDNFDQILSVADGIMVARGDLGVEIPIQKVCMAQKMMIRKSNIVGKPVITATQMLESMITNPRPTRAEATDVANAVFDGTDCVMLSGETAKGDYPMEAVQVMSQICRSAEEAFDYDNFFVSMLYHSRKRMNKAEAIASSAVKTAHDLSVPLIFVMTESGSTARAVSKYKPKIPVITLTTNPRTARQCMVSRALYPICVPADKIDAAAPEPAVYGGHSVTGALHFGYDFAKKKRWVEVGDETVLVSGLVHGVSGGTNTLKVLSVE